LEFINIGGGFGIPYKPGDQPMPLKKLAALMKKLFEDHYYKVGRYKPRLFMENGRFITGPHGVLVTRVINRMKKYKEYVGVDACCTSTMMRPAMYYNAEHNPWGGYHEISVFGGEGRPLEKVNVVGSACENNDQFGRDRLLPKVTEGDVILVDDTGAHCYAMANNYNSRLRPAELMLLENGEVVMIRRAETMKDYFATLEF
jgi:diaminopimelate decarboxylase